MDTFAQWLRAEVTRRYPSQASFARAAGVREQLVSQWLAGKDIPTMANVMAIARGLHTDYHVVARQAGYDLPDQPPPRSPDDILEELRANAPLPVPIVQDVAVSAGPGRPVDEYQYLPPAFRRGRHTNILGVIAQGTSMVPEIQPGDYVIFDADTVAQIGDIVVAVVGGEAFVKRLAQEGKRLVLRGDADGGTLPLNEDARIVGRVIFITRPK